MLREKFWIRQVRESDTKVSDMYKSYVLASVLLKLLLILSVVAENRMLSDTHCFLHTYTRESEKVSTDQQRPSLWTELL